MKIANKIISMFCIACCLAGCKDSDETVPPASLTLEVPTVNFDGRQSNQIVKIDATRRWTAIPSDFWITVTPEGYPGANDHFVVNMSVGVLRNDSGGDRDGYVAFFIGDEQVAKLIVNQNTEGADEEPDEQYPITWANHQWVASTAILEGAIFEAGSCVFADGITNAVESTTGEGITCDIGYSTDDTSPDGAGWTWVACWFNGDWGNNFYYQGRIEDLTAGTYYFTFRYRNGEGPYKYAGSGGLWDGVDNVNGSFTVEAAGGGDDIDYSQYTITWANLQWKGTDPIQTGETFEAGSKIYINGLTNQDAASATGEGVLCDIGYSSTNSDPSGAGWTWISCPFSADWGNEFYYQGATSAISEPGTYYYTFRYKMGANGTYAYAGSEGLWDGTTNVNGSFVVQGAGRDYSGYTISWANLQWAGGSFAAGGTFNAGSKVFIAGLTDQAEASTDGEGVLCDIGYSSTDSDPSGAGWTWNACPFSADWGNEFYYQGYTSAIATPGTYYYTFRYKMGPSGSYVYAGSNGVWDGMGNVNGTFTVTP